MEVILLVVEHICISAWYSHRSSFFLGGGVTWTLLLLICWSLKRLLGFRVIKFDRLRPRFRYRYFFLITSLFSQLLLSAHFSLLFVSFIVYVRSTRFRFFFMAGLIELLLGPSLSCTWTASVYIAVATFRSVLCVANRNLVLDQLIEVEVTFSILLLSLGIIIVF
jgi:hypothetical protein